MTRASPHDAFIAHSIEWSPDDHKVIARDRRSYLEYELERLWSAEFDPDDMRRSAELFGYGRIGEFLAKWDA